MAKPYDEDAVLTGYVWNHYQHLMTLGERTVGKAAAFEEKAEAYDPSPVSRRLRSMAGVLKADPSVATLLDLPASEFRRSVRNRLMSQHGERINLNRCPNCNRIPHTPRAQQCPWCHHSWRHS